LFPILALAACEASSLSRGQGGSGGGAAGAGGTGGGTGGVVDAGFGGAGGQISCWWLNPTDNDVEVGTTSTPDAGTPNENCPTTDTPPSDPSALRVYDLVEASQHARLQQIVGQFVCGTGSIYRGTFAAQDNAGSAGGVNGVINSGPVIAALETRSSTNTNYFLSCTEVVKGARALRVIATAQSKAILLFQLLGGDQTTYSSLVAGPGVGFSGDSGACTGCVADLRGAPPASLSIGPVTMIGPYCAGDSTRLEVNVSGQLTMLPSPSVADFLEMNQQYADPDGYVDPLPNFAQQGDEMVATVNGTLYENFDPGRQTGIATPFHVDWFVNSQNVTLFGLRNFRIDATLPICVRSGI
jgi:hypothetical protein